MRAHKRECKKSSNPHFLLLSFRANCSFFGRIFPIPQNDAAPLTARCRATSGHSLTAGANRSLKNSPFRSGSSPLASISSYNAYAAAVSTLPRGRTTNTLRGICGSFSTHSPLPVTRASPPVYIYGTSEPRVRRKRASGVSPRAAANSLAMPAAAAEEPPNPAPDGMPFWMRKRKSPPKRARSFSYTAFR